MTIRVGQGCDVHAFGPGDKIVIGGVVIPHSKGLIAHSDGDVLLHALCDAMLGAAGLGDIGKHFPDTSAEFKNINSRELLRLCKAKLAAKHFSIVNVDMTIVAQAPKMASYISAMVENIANDLGCTKDDVNVKATTTERLGFTGREEGIAAQAVVLIQGA